MDDLIESMARTYYEAESSDARRYHWGGGPSPWTGLTQNERDIRYDAMHAALKELLEPTDEMVAVGTESAETCVKDDPCGKAGRHVWSDMINKLLEVK